MARDGRDPVPVEGRAGAGGGHYTLDDVGTTWEEIVPANPRRARGVDVFNRDTASTRNIFVQMSDAQPIGTDDAVLALHWSALGQTHPTFIPGTGAVWVRRAGSTNVTRVVAVEV